MKPQFGGFFVLVLVGVSFALETEANTLPWWPTNSAENNINVEKEVNVENEDNYVNTGNILAERNKNCLISIKPKSQKKFC